MILRLPACRACDVPMYTGASSLTVDPGEKTGDTTASWSCCWCREPMSLRVPETLAAHLVVGGAQVVVPLSEHVAEAFAEQLDSLPDDADLVSLIAGD